MSGFNGVSYNCGGKDYPRVSSILGILDKGFALDKWKAKTIKQKLTNDYLTLLEAGRAIDIELLADAALQHPNVVRDARGDTGTQIHDALEARLDASKDHTPFLTDYSELFRNCEKWIDEYQIEPIATEARLCSHDYEYGGTVDLIAYQKYEDTKQIALIDFKTGSGVYDTSTLQLAAYSQAYKEMNKDAPDKWPDMCYIMHIDRDKYTFKEKKHIHRYNKKTKEFEIEREFNAFLAVRNAYRWRYNK